MSSIVVSPNDENCSCSCHTIHGCLGCKECGCDGCPTCGVTDCHNKTGDIRNCKGPCEWRVEEVTFETDMPPEVLMTPEYQESIEKKMSEDEEE
jgi:hypothetical protein